MKQFLIIQLILYFGWLSCIAVAQLEISGAITGSASFPHVGITCLGNLAVFITSFIRKRLDLEMAARDFLVINASPSKFKEFPEREQKEKVSCIRKLADFIPNFLRRLPDIEIGAGEENNKHELIAVTPQYPPEASVVILSNSAGMTNSCITQFMQYIYNAHDVYSALLKYDILKDSTEVPDSHCKGHNCNCIVISKVEGINMPQVPKELPESQVPKESTESQVPQSRVLLPSLQCLENKCHGCNPHLLHVEEIEGSLNVEFSYAACYALDFKFRGPTQKEPIWICIPVNDDKWTKLLVRFLKYKDQEDKGAIVAAADALQNYLDRPQKRAEDRTEERAEDRTEKRAEDREVRAEDRAEEIKYKTVSLIVIRLVEIFVNLLLTVFFKVDGFSSALAARRAVRSFVVDSKGNGLPANVFLTSGLVVVKSDSVCQVLKFRGNILFWLMLLSTFFVNLLCAVAWAVVLIAFNGGIGKWYAVPSMAPSKPRVAVIIAAICIGIGMDCSDLAMKWSQIFGNSGGFKNFLKQNWKEISREIKKDMKITLILPGVIILEIAFAVAVAVSLNKGIERWVYGALQLLVWVKWGIGSYILGAYSPEYVSTSSEPKYVDGSVILKYSSAKWVEEGSLVYSSSFLLNAVMVGVMGDWAGIWSTWK